MRAIARQLDMNVVAELLLHCAGAWLRMVEVVSKGANVFWQTPEGGPASVNNHSVSSEARSSSGTSEDPAGVCARWRCRQAKHPP